MYIAFSIVDGLEYRRSADKGKLEKLLIDTWQAYQDDEQLGTNRWIVSPNTLFQDEVEIAELESLSKDLRKRIERQEHVR
jgi:hypothetical protein